MIDIEFYDKHQNLKTDIDDTLMLKLDENRYRIQEFFDMMINDKTINVQKRKKYLDQNLIITNKYLYHLLRTFDGLFILKHGRLLYLKKYFVLIDNLSRGFKSAFYNVKYKDFNIDIKLFWKKYYQDKSQALTFLITKTLSDYLPKDKSIIMKLLDQKSIDYNEEAIHSTSCSFIFNII